MKDQESRCYFVGVPPVYSLSALEGRLFSMVRSAPLRHELVNGEEDLALCALSERGLVYCAARGPGRVETRRWLWVLTSKGARLDDLSEIEAKEIRPNLV